MQQIFLKTVLLVVCVCSASAQCPPRNEVLAEEVGRPCARLCAPGLRNQCEAGFYCMCDHECGFTCMKLVNYCPSPPRFPNAEDAKVHRRLRNETFVLATAPYTYNDVAEYPCKPGYKREEPSIPHLCHAGRGWTGTTTCALSCRPYNSFEVSRSGMTCGDSCVTDGSCRDGLLCRCDGHCGRTCVDPDTDCAEAPRANNADITYKGTGFGRLAMYKCRQGFYTHSGSALRKCTGGGTWDGSSIRCERITCGNLQPALTAMGGGVISSLQERYYLGDTVTLFCSPGYRMIGPRERTCLENGRWSGRDTICDLEDNEKRCRHPGIPVNGNLVRSNGFGRGSSVEFSCNRGFSMIGERIQECLYFLQWSGGGAPSCIDPRYPDRGNKVLESLQRSAEETKMDGKSASVGRVIGGSTQPVFEVYFVFDMSQHVLDEDLEKSLMTAQDWVKRVSAEGLTKCTILLFASRVHIYYEKLLVNSSEVVNNLQNVLIDRHNLVSSGLGRGRNTAKALIRFNETLAASFAEYSDVTRHVFLFIHGRRNEGSNSVAVLENITHSYGDRLRQMYVVAFGLSASDSINFNELQELAFLIEERRVLLNIDTSDIETLFEIRSDSGDNRACGKAGDVGDVKQQARIGRVLQGSSVAGGAWPWQAAITRYQTQVVATYKQSSFLGGGTVINNRWVLTAAHLFADLERSSGWQRSIFITFGLTRRPSRRNEFLSSYVQAFEAEEIIEHANFSQDFDYDIALLKLGKRYIQHNSRWRLSGDSGWLNYTSHVKPVCLPCTKSPCFSNFLQKSGVSIHSLPDEERCLTEENFLLELGEEDKIGLSVATGFGHVERREQDDFTHPSPSDYLQQGLLRLQHKQKCERIARDVIPWNGYLPILYTERMLCAISGVPGQIVDTCNGDSGGPLVREVYDEDTKTSCWVQIGIVSWGWGCGLTYRNHRGQMSQFPGYYTNVVSLVSWIRKNIGDCPRELSKVELGRKCPKACETDSDCRGAKKRCLCDGACGLSCYNPEANCRHPGEVENGRVLGSRKIGEKLTYSCEDGFALNGTSQRICRGDKTWSGGAPVCVRKQVLECPSIMISNGGSTCTSNQAIGSLCHHRCNGEFQLMGSQFSVCARLNQLPPAWTPALPRCQARCTTIAIRNGGTVCSQANTLGSVCNHTCDEGYALVGAPISRCAGTSLNRVWMPSLPSCQEACPPILIQNGSVSSCTNGQMAGSICKLECNSGFVLKGAYVTSCAITRDAVLGWSIRLPMCQECGVKNKVQRPLLGQLISGGTVAEPNEWPWVVFINFGIQPNIFASRSFCTGALINSKYVMTAGSCVQDSFSSTNTIVSSNRVFVWVGAHNRRMDAIGNTNARSISVNKIIRHPNYAQATLNDFDIALLRLSEHVEANDFIRPICLPKTDEDFNSLSFETTTGSVAGWGFYNSRRISEVLRYTSMPLVTSDRCWNSFRRTSIQFGFPLPRRSSILTENNFCAGYAGGGTGSTCNGDSGSPYMVKRAGTGKYYSHGISSFGIAQSRCGESMSYDGFTYINRRISGWIHENMRNF